MGALIGSLARLHNGIFYSLQFALENWLLGLLARLTFASVLLTYFWNSAFTKVIANRPPAGRVAQGPLDYLGVESNAYAQIAPKAFEEAGFDASQLGFQYDLMAHAGTYAEFLLPALILVGLFTRVAAVGMIGFILVMSVVDVTGHGVAFSGAQFFDATETDAIADQRLLWAFPLVYLALRGAGAASLDYVFAGRRRAG